MAKHKAATEITLVQEERSGFAEFVDRYKWHGIGALIAIGAVVFWRANATTQSLESDRADWAGIYKALNGGPNDGAEDRVSKLASAAAAAETPSAKSVANLYKASILTGEKEYGSATDALRQLGANAPAALSKLEFPMGPDGAGLSVTAALDAAITREANWATDHAFVYQNKLPETSPSVTLETSEGTIVVGLFLASTPGHVKSFIGQVSGGSLDGTLLHGPAIGPSGQPMAGRGVRGGDPNTRDSEDTATWGLGGGAGTINREDNKLTHEKGAVAAIVLPGEQRSSRTQFMILTEPMHDNDSKYVVFGKVIEGIEIVEKLADAPLREGQPPIFEEPAKIVSATVNN